MESILTLNAGSSSLKFGLYRRAAHEPVIKGQIRNMPHAPELVAHRLTDGKLHREDLGHDTANLKAILSVIDDLAPELDIVAVGHRVVHGGSVFTGPARITDDAYRQIADLSVLAPLHQPAALHAIDLAKATFPEAVQTASFDTSFHAGQPTLAKLYGLPRHYYDEGIRRYGFHGLSYDYIAHFLEERLPAERRGRAVVAHLGSGASLCAMRDGRSVESSMGFSALEGLPMSTRPGSIDPGVLLHLLRQEGMSAEALEDLLYHKSGLLGLSGISGDAAVLLKSDDPGAEEALAYFCYRTALGIGQMAAALGGLDTLVFTAGIGENAPAIRKSISAYLGYLGVAIDDQANSRNDFDLSTDGAAVMTLMCHTDEEAILRRDAEALLKQMPA